MMKRVRKYEISFGISGKIIATTPGPQRLK
jgi:hypothetical protein